jgi:exodeoxyribonuclease VII large subunit
MDFSETIFTVSRLTEHIKDLLEGEFPFLWLEGEISNFRIPPSGHCYFTLKDSDSQIRAVFFKSGQWGLSFKPENGLQVLCFGRLGVYAARGEYQIIIERMELKGWGALQLAFERLKEKLLKEGLFDRERKKALPLLPRRVAIITSPTGAVIQDFLKILHRRHPNIHVYLCPVTVQGETASFEIAEAIKNLNCCDLGLEVIILARGGGSIEDLWPFNEERVARAIAASSIPIISAVGHEVDFTIADFTADLRASTPSAAAELLIHPQKEWETRIRDLQYRLVQPLQREMRLYEEKLFHFQQRLGDPRRRLIDLNLRLDDLTLRLQSALRRSVSQNQEAFQLIREKLTFRSPSQTITSLQNNLALWNVKTGNLIRRRVEQAEMNLSAQLKALKALSPWAVLDRGYALVRTLPELRVVKEAEETSPGRRVRVSLSHGELDCLVEETRKVPLGS